MSKMNRKEKLHLVLFLGTGFILRLITAPLFEGHPIDMACFKGWAQAASNGLSGFYQSGMFVDYPPVYIYVLFVMGNIMKFLEISQDSTAGIILIKLPSVLADVVISYCIYRLARETGVPVKRDKAGISSTKETTCMILAAFFLFNPLIFLNSTIWGQVDSFLTLLVLLSFFSLLKGRLKPGWVLFTLAVLMKPQGLVFTPVLLCETLKRKKIKDALISLVYAAVTAAAVILPFSRGQSPLWIVRLFLKTAEEYPYATLNAFNLYMLAGSNGVKDSSAFLFLTYRAWGYIFIVGLTLFVGYLYIKQLKRIKALPLLCGAILSAGTFLLTVRMHERYMFPVVALLLAGSVLTGERRLLRIFAGFSLTNFLNVLLVLLEAYKKQYFLSPAHIPGRVISLANLLLFAWLLKVVVDIVLKDKLLSSLWPGLESDPIRKGEPGEKGASEELMAPEALEDASSLPPDFTSVKIDRTDLIIMTVMTLLYLVPALVNLGGFKVPQTAWRAAQPGESYIMDLGAEYDVTRIYYYNGLGEGRFRLEYQDGKGDFLPLYIQDPNIKEKSNVFEKNDFYKWQYVNVKARAGKIRVTAERAGGALNEMAVFREGSTSPVEGVRVMEGNGAVPGSNAASRENAAAGTEGEGRNGSSLAHLFDEQDTVEYAPSYMTSTYFDEIYHVRTAYEHLHRIEPYETTHPPLGKVFISIGIAIFGMNPFGWRIIGTLFGAAMIPLMYLFGRKLFGGKFYAFSASFLMMFDFMHFSQTRIGTIDVYAVFFIILMYYFIYDSFMIRAYTVKYSQSLKPLLLSGFFFGMGAACKWIALYGAAGLALLFTAARYLEYKDYRLYAVKSTTRMGKSYCLAQYFKKYILQTSLYCVLFFVIIPAVIYILSYIPFMRVPGPGHGIRDVFTYQFHMLKYHSQDVLQATHPFSSPPWQWPFIVKPLWFFSGSDLPPGKASSIVTMGNPAIWWTGVPAVLLAAVIAFRKKDKGMLVVFVALVFQYLPWFRVPRMVFIYHYFSSVPFVIFCIVYVIKAFLEPRTRTKPVRKIQTAGHPGKYAGISGILHAFMQSIVIRYRRYAVYTYMGIVLVLFVMFYPVLSGMVVDKAYIEQYLRWFKNTWYF